MTVWLWTMRLFATLFLPTAQQSDPWSPTSMQERVKEERLRLASMNRGPVFEVVLLREELAVASEAAVATRDMQWRAALAAGKKEP